MSSNKKTGLQNFDINVKIKLAGLWTAVTFCYLYGDYFELYTPEKVESLISGDNVLGSPFSLFIASFVLALPALMIALSLVLKPMTNKWLNIVFGSFFTIIMVLIGIGSITPWYSFYVFYAAIEVVLTFAIVWQAIKWPREITI
jgi:hypothetical protein